MPKGNLGDENPYLLPDPNQPAAYEELKAARAGSSAAAGDGYAVPQDAINPIKQFSKKGVFFTFTRLPDQDVSLQVDGVPGSGVKSGTYYLESGNPTFEAISIDNFDIAENGVPTFNGSVLENLQVDNLYAYHNEAIQTLRQGVQDRKAAADEVSATQEAGYEVPAALAVKAGFISKADNAARIDAIQKIVAAKKASEENKVKREITERQESLQKYLSEPNPIKKKSLLTQYVMGCVGSNGISFYGDQVNIDAGKRVILETAMDDFKVTGEAIPKEFMTDIMEAMSAFGVTNRFDADAIRKINTASEQLIRISQKSDIGERAVTAAAKELQKQVFNLYGLDNTKQGQSPDLVAKANIHFATSVELALGEENAPKVIANANQRAVLTPGQLDDQKAAIRNAKTSDAVRRADASGLVSAADRRAARTAFHEAEADATVTQEGVFKQIAEVVGAKEAKDALNQGGSVSVGGLTITKENKGRYNISNGQEGGDAINFTVYRSKTEDGYSDFSLSERSTVPDHNLQSISESLQEDPAINKGIVSVQEGNIFGTFKRENSRGPVDEGIDSPGSEFGAGANLLDALGSKASPTRVQLDPDSLRARGGASIDAGPPSAAVSSPTGQFVGTASRGISGLVSSQSHVERVEQARNESASKGSGR